MWKDNNDNFEKVLDSINGNILDNVCPECGKKELHVYFIKEENKKIGSCWVWCSHCHNYSHYRGLVPDWWKNLLNIDLTQLTSEPNYLEEKKECIDKHIKTLK